jgi:hypothetical protein
MLNYIENIIVLIGLNILNNDYYNKNDIELIIESDKNDKPDKLEIIEENIELNDEVIQLDEIVFTKEYIKIQTGKKK